MFFHSPSDKLDKGEGGWFLLVISIHFMEWEGFYGKAFFMTWRHLFTHFRRVLLLTTLLTLGMGGFGNGEEPADQWVYIGNYLSDPTPEMIENHLGKPKGIYVADYDSRSGKIGVPRLAFEMNSPNFFALSPDKRILYAISSSGVYSFTVDPKTGDLTLLNQSESETATCYCHVSVSPDGRFLATSDYSGGFFDFYRLNPDGSIGDFTARFDKPGGSKGDPRRQMSPFGHSAYFIQDGEILRAFLVDLGSDRVSIVRIDPETGKPTPDPEIPELKVPTGHGSRHMAWTRNDDGSLWIFVNNELASTVTFFRVSFDKEGAKMDDYGTFSTLPAEFAGKVDWEQAKVDAEEGLTLMNSTAEVAFREGRNGNPPTVYVSNRGHDSIAVFQVITDGDQPTLRPIQFQPTFGVAPRYFEIDKPGDHLLACNKRSGSIYSFRIAEDGTLTKLDYPPVRTPWPVALAFIDKE